MNVERRRMGLVMEFHVIIIHVYLKEDEWNGGGREGCLFTPIFADEPRLPLIEQSS